MTDQQNSSPAPPVIAYDPAVIGDRQARLSDKDWRDLTNWKILPDKPEAKEAVERAMTIYRLTKDEPPKRLSPADREKAKKIATYLEKAAVLIDELAPAVNQKTSLYKKSLRPEVFRVREISGWFHQLSEGRRGKPARGLLRALVGTLADIQYHFSKKRLGGRDQNLIRFVLLVVQRSDEPDKSFSEATIKNALRSVVDQDRRKTR